MANVNLRLDDDLKLSMENVCRELGMNLTTAFTIFAKKMSRERRIPFDVSLDTNYIDEKRKSRERLLNSIEMIQKNSLSNGVDGLTLAEINAEISESRKMV